MYPEKDILAHTSYLPGPEGEKRSCRTVIRGRTGSSGTRVSRQPSDAMPRWSLLLSCSLPARSRSNHLHREVLRPRERARARVSGRAGEREGGGIPLPRLRRHGAHQEITSASTAGSGAGSGAGFGAGASAILSNRSRTIS